MTISQRSEAPSIGDPKLEPLLNERDYARIANRSVASVRRDRRLGNGCSYVKLGALVRYRPGDVKAFLERNLHGGDAK